MSCSSCNPVKTCNPCSTCYSCNSNHSCDGWNHWNNCDSWNGWNWRCHDCSGCSRWAQPIVSSCAQFSDAGTLDGATLVIHKIVLEPCGNQSCTPRTFNIRITGPSYPNGEIFQLRAGSCLELDEPLVIAGLEPGVYCIEEVFACRNEYISTFTGPVCGRQVTVNGYAPTVVTIVSRKRLCHSCSRTCW